LEGGADDMVFALKLNIWQLACPNRELNSSAVPLAQHTGVTRGAHNTNTQKNLYHFIHIFMHYRFYFTFLTLILLISCQSNSNKPTQSAVSQAITAPISLRYAKNFEVHYFDTHKALTVRIGENIKKYALVPRGKPFPKGYKPEEIIEIPVRTCVLASHTHIACLQALGLQASLKGLTEASYLPDNALQKLLRQGEIREVGKDGDWQTEVLFALKPDLVMLNGMGNETKLKLPAQSKTVVNTDWQENHPLGRAEWLLFISLFFDAEARADSICKQIITEYETLRDQLTQAKLPKKQVLLDVPYKGTWYMPAGKSYISTLLKDVHATYAWQTNDKTGSIPLDFEGVFAEAKNASVWLNVGICKNLQDITALDSRLAQVPAWKNGEVYSYQKRASSNGTNPYFMQSILHPHLLLADLAKLLHPTFKDTQKHVLYYYEKLK